jgi:hypothetical protein
VSLDRPLLFLAALEAVVLGDSSRFEELFTDDVVFCSPHMRLESLASVHHGLGSPEDSLTDVDIVVVALDAIDDKVVAEWRLEATFTRAVLYDDRLLIEGFIDGEEYAVEALMTRGRLRVLAIFDKPDLLDGPFFEETIYVTPTEISNDVQSAVVAELRRGAAALGLVHGPIHAECRVSRRGVVMLEIAARPIGGLCSRVLRFSAGGERVSLEEVLLRHCCGEDVAVYQREDAASGVMMMPIPKRGILKKVRGEEDARKVAHIEDVRITAKRDQLLEPLPEGDSYLGFIFARGRSALEVTTALREAHRRLTFDIDPAIPVLGAKAVH